MTPKIECDVPPAGWECTRPTSYGRRPSSTCGTARFAERAMFAADSAVIALQGTRATDADKVEAAVNAAAPHILQARDAEVEKLRAQVERLKHGGEPDISPGDVIAAEPDGTIVLDDGITTWNPSRATGFLIAYERQRAAKAEAQLAKVRELRDELDAKARDRRWVSDYRMALGRIVERIDAVLGEEENDAN